MQIQLLHGTNTVVLSDKYHCNVSCHGLKHLWVFPSLLEFQPSPIFLPIELSYCIIAMHWNGSFPRIVFPSHSFPPLITIQPAQHWHWFYVFWHFSWYTPFHFFWEILKITHDKKYTLWAPGMLWNTCLFYPTATFVLPYTFRFCSSEGISQRISCDAVQMDLSPNKSPVCLFQSDINSGKYLEMLSHQKSETINQLCPRVTATTLEFPGQFQSLFFLEARPGSKVIQNSDGTNSWWLLEQSCSWLVCNAPT